MVITASNPCVLFVGEALRGSLQRENSVGHQPKGIWCQHVFQLCTTNESHEDRGLLDKKQQTREPPPMRTVFKINLYAFFLVVSCRVEPTNLDIELRQVLRQQNITPLFRPDLNKDQVELGEKLFFDKILSGNRDLSCSGCHHPTLASSDRIPLSIGTRGEGLGPTRLAVNGAARTPRHSLEIFNRGYQSVTAMFWDSRVEQLPDGSIVAPHEVPTSVKTALAAQAMFPVLSREEMRGQAGDIGKEGAPNELALLDDDDPEVIWSALMTRVLSFERYVDLLAAAFPAVPTNELNFGHVATAIAAYETSAFTLLNSPWDQYVAGDDEAIPDAAKRGALLFFGEANCVSCHSGNLFSDQKHYNIAAPQISQEGVLDVGREGVTGDSKDRFAFRTPPLRNVTVTGPYLHNGAFADLKDVVNHHQDPQGSLQQYDPTQLGPSLVDFFISDDETLTTLLASLDPLLQNAPALDEAQRADLLSFLVVLEDPVAHLVFTTVPEFVPSGLPTDY
jgi:cytochrome c peroxidase